MASLFSGGPFESLKERSERYARESGTMDLYVDAMKRGGGYMVACFDTKPCTCVYFGGYNYRDALAFVQTKPGHCELLFLCDLIAKPL